MLQQFIQKLLDNPNFAGQPETAKEMQISNFIEQNKNNLAPLLAGPQFFPGMPLHEAAEKLVAQVRKRTADSVLKRIKHILPTAVDPDFQKKLPGSFDISRDEFLGNLNAYYEKIAGHRDARARIEALAIVLEEQFVDKYLAAAYEEKSYLYNEMFRVEKHKFDLNDAMAYLKLAATLVPGYHVKLNMGAGKDVHALDLRTQTALQKKYFEKSRPLLKSLLQQVHDDLWSTAEAACMDEKEYGGHVDPGGKFLAILFTAPGKCGKIRRSKRERKLRTSPGFPSR